jgi:hypothetical protein
MTKKITQAVCRKRWEALKAAGTYTSADLELIDHDTPWSHSEPAWWLEMMDALKELQAAERAAGLQTSCRVTSLC